MILGAGKMAQKLASAALPKDSSSIPNNHKVVHDDL